MSHSSQLEDLRGIAINDLIFLTAGFCIGSICLCIVKRRVNRYLHRLANDELDFSEGPLTDDEVNKKIKKMKKKNIFVEVENVQLELPYSQVDRTFCLDAFINTDITFLFC